MSNEEMIVELNTVVEALNKHDLKLMIEDYKRLREENERLLQQAYILAMRLLQSEYYNQDDTDRNAVDYVLQLWREGRGK